MVLSIRLGGRKFMRLTLAIVVALIVPSNLDASDDEFFEAKVRPILAENCYSCHSGTEAARGLKLDSPNGFRTDDGQGWSSCRGTSMIVA